MYVLSHDLSLCSSPMTSKLLLILSKWSTCYLFHQRHYCTYLDATLWTYFERTLKRSVVHPRMTQNFEVIFCQLVCPHLSKFLKNRINGRLFLFLSSTEAVPCSFLSSSLLKVLSSSSLTVFFSSDSVFVETGSLTEDGTSSTICSVCWSGNPYASLLANASRSKSKRISDASKSSVLV